MYSKNKIDNCGKSLSRQQYKSEEYEIECEIIFDEYRKSHLQPLTETTMIIQKWLENYEGDYYIAQRLKRKPQILRKLKRFSVRLSQLQDIAGNRIIVNTNNDVDKLRYFISQKLKEDSIKVYRETDYRVLGRDDTGYRALHIILEKDDIKIELQIRSRAQHYWAESIERTSVVYGRYLKENDGAPEVIDYFKHLSKIFYEIESGREPSSLEKIELDRKREIAESIIKREGKGDVLSGYVNDSILHTLSTVEKKKKQGINNWILIFDWNSGCFVNWIEIPRDPAEAYEAYEKTEQEYEEKSGYEVVLVGSSNIEMIRKTHSHYFGIDGYDEVLKNLDESIIGFSSRNRLDSVSRRILLVMRRKGYFGKKTLTIDTLKNHYCKVLGVEDSLKKLQDMNLIIYHGKNGPVSLNVSKQDEINSYL